MDADGARAIHLRHECRSFPRKLVKEMDRSRFKGMTGLADRTADRVLADLFKLGIVTSKSPKGPVGLALPMHLFRYLFPRLWPEAESS